MHKKFTVWIWLLSICTSVGKSAALKSSELACTQLKNVQHTYILILHRGYDGVWNNEKTKYGHVHQAKGGTGVNPSTHPTPLQQTIKQWQNKGKSLEQEHMLLKTKLFRSKSFVVWWKCYYLRHVPLFVYTVITFSKNLDLSFFSSLAECQRYTYRVLQTIQMKLILLCVWAELAVLGSTKTAIKFIYKI